MSVMKSTISNGNGLVWLLGGGIMQVPMATAILDLGYRLFVTDASPNCECAGMTHYFMQADIYNVAKQMDIARQLGESPAAVLTVGTDAGAEVAAIADYFKLPGVNPQVAANVRNKATMRDMVTSPVKYQTGFIDEFSEWDIWPCVVKPNNASGSRGLSVVKNDAEFRRALVKASQANRVGARVVVEEKLTGVDVMPELSGYATSEVALDFFVEHGTVHYANGALRLFWRDSSGLEAGHINPFIPDDQIMTMAQNAAEELGVKWGPFKLDLMYTQEYGWVILETATRLSGGFDHMYTGPMATGKDITRAMLDIALGLPLDRKKLFPLYNGYACAIAPRFKPGKIDGWQNGSEGKTFYRTTTEIKPLIDNGDRPLFVLASGSTERQALDKTLAEAAKITPNYI